MSCFVELIRYLVQVRIREPVKSGKPTQTIMLKHTQSQERTTPKSKIRSPCEMSNSCMKVELVKFKLEVLQNQEAPKDRDHLFDEWERTQLNIRDMKNQSYKELNAY